MKSRIKLLWIVVLLAVAFVGCSAVQAAPQEGSQVAVTETSDPVRIVPGSVAGGQRSITVVGVGRVNLKPDIAKLNVGAQSSASTVTEAKADVDATMAAITDVLAELGVDAADVQTSHYSIHYEREPMAPVMREGPVGETQGVYRVSSMLEVTVRKIEQVGSVLDAVVEAGANAVYGVTFTVSDPAKWQSQAREDAMTDAKARAAELARLADVELGETLSISEVIGGGPVPMPALAIERGMGGGGIAPGELEFSAQIQVVYAID